MRPTLGAALRDMLGPSVGIGVTDPTDSPDDLWADEAAALARAIPKRRAEFAAGRRAARAAMAMLGLPAAAIPQGADRAPIWPAGLTGSIAHCDHACIAAVSTTHISLGIDIEPATPLESDLWDIICTAPERHWIACQPDAGRAAKQIFSAKEAIYKAQYPITRRVIGFDAVTVSIAPDGGFAVTSPHDLPPLTGRISEGDGVILSTCIHQP